MIKTLCLACCFASSVYASDELVVNSGEQQTAIVELFTSEGCSSCPPADHWFSQLRKVTDDDVKLLPLAFHVDYWNYLGWQDRFSQSKFTSRQRLLGANNRQSNIYTPEFFVNGRETRGSQNVLNRIKQINQTASPLALQLSVSRQGEKLRCKLKASELPDAAENSHVRYLVYENNLTTEVRKGENAGETLQHQNVVRFISRAFTLNSENQIEIPLAADWNIENTGVAVLVTSPGSEQYIQAVHTDLAGLTL